MCCHFSAPSSCCSGVRLSNLEETPVNSLETFFKKRSTGEDESRLGPATEMSLQERDEESLCSSERERQPHGEEKNACSSLREGVASTSEKDATSMYNCSEAAVVFRAEEQVNCPICGMVIMNDNAALNQHIDLCLNRGTLAEVARSGAPPVDTPPETTGLTQTSSLSMKGRKRQQQRNTPEKAKKSRTHSPVSSMKLDKYFK